MTTNDFLSRLPNNATPENLREALTEALCCLEEMGIDFGKDANAEVYHRLEAHSVLSTFLRYLEINS